MVHYKRVFGKGELDNMLAKPLSGRELVSVAEHSNAWQAHAKLCKKSRIIQLQIDGQSIDPSENIKRESKHLDRKIWESQLEQRQQDMLEHDRRALIEKQSPFLQENTAPAAAKSANFNSEKESGVYTSHEFAVGCMCGQEVSITAPNQKQNPPYLENGGKSSGSEDDGYASPSGLSAPDKSYHKSSGGKTTQQQEYSP